MNDNNNPFGNADPHNPFPEDGGAAGGNPNMLINEDPFLDDE